MRLRLFATIMLCLSLLTSGCENVDIQLVVDAGIDAITAVTLSDEEVKGMAMEAAKLSDNQNTIAGPNNYYAQRVHRLTQQQVRQGDFVFDIKVYESSVVNAFAMADGTIRIYSGLMDMMDDGELLFVIGHEIGHVVKDHIRRKIQLAYAGRAVRKGAASLNNEVGDIARSSIGDFTEKLMNAQFSQHEEREADDYGLVYLEKAGYDPKFAISALEKLATLGTNHTFLSSHPDPDKRAARLAAQLQ